MGSDLINYTKGHPCHICLRHSSNPKKCTHCGASIESIDINEAIFKPPEHGTYFASTLHYSDESVLRAAKSSEEDFYQNYRLLKKKHGYLISSNETAYQVFVKKLGEESGVNIADIMEKVPFIVIKEKDNP